MGLEKNSLNRLANFSSGIRDTTLKKLKKVPEGFINWRLNNLAMSFGDIAQHLINVDELLFSLATTRKKKFKWTLGTEAPHLNVDKSTYEFKLKKLKEFQLKRHSIVASFNDSALNDIVIDDIGQKMTLWWFLMHKVIEHEVYHTGQISAYLKVLKGETSVF